MLSGKTFVAMSVALLLTAGCGGTTRSNAQVFTGTIKGDFIAVGGPSGASNSPQKGTISLTNATTKQTFTVTSGADGKFSISVPEGTYTATGLTPQYMIDGHQAQCDNVTPAVVTFSKTTMMTVVCPRR